MIDPDASVSKKSNSGETPGVDWLTKWTPSLNDHESGVTEVTVVFGARGELKVTEMVNRSAAVTFCYPGHAAAGGGKLL
jgi:hypothetical protein